MRDEEWLHLVHGEPSNASPVAACGEATKPGLVAPDGSLDHLPPLRGEWEIGCWKPSRSHYFGKPPS
jgi:hypothetical protein